MFDTLFFSVLIRCFNSFIRTHFFPLPSCTVVFLTFILVTCCLSYGCTYCQQVCGFHSSPRFWAYLSFYTPPPHTHTFSTFCGVATFFAGRGQFRYFWFFVQYDSSWTASLSPHLPHISDLAQFPLR